MSDISVVDIEALAQAADTAYEAAASQVQSLTEVSVTLIQKSLDAMRKVAVLARNPDTALNPSNFGLESVAADLATVQLGLAHAMTHIAHIHKLVADASLAVNAAAFNYGDDNGEGTEYTGTDPEDEDPRN